MMDKEKNQKKISFSDKRGFTLLFASLVSGVLLSVGLVIFDMSIMESRLASSGRDSQNAIFAADSGAECALFWGIKGNAFSTSTTSTITCNRQNFTVGGSYSSQFTINFLPASSCVVVNVNTTDSGGTVIESRGYNTCDVENTRRVERAIRVSY